MQTLLDAKPTLMNATDREGRNLLHLACAVSPTRVQKSEANAARVGEFLFDHGLEVDEPVGRDACTALFFAVARARSRTLVKLLLKRGRRLLPRPAADCSLRAGGKISTFSESCSAPGRQSMSW